MKLTKYATKKDIQELNTLGYIAAKYNKRVYFDKDFTNIKLQVHILRSEIDIDENGLFFAPCGIHKNQIKSCEVNNKKMSLQELLNTFAEE